MTTSLKSKFFQRKKPGKETIDDFIERCAMPEPNSGCLIWVLSLDPYGYGHIGKRDQNGKMVTSAHRYVWILAHGSIPDKMSVLHRCDVRCCINPNHLFLGDTKANMSDCANKNRTSFGERHPTSKLTNDLVKYIRRSVKNDRLIAQEIGIRRAHVSAVRAGRIWKRVV